MTSLSLRSFWLKFGLRGLGLMVSLWVAVPFAFSATLSSQGASAANQAGSGISTFFQSIYEKAPSWIAAMVVFACSFVFARMMKEKVVDKVSQKFAQEDQDVLVLVGRATYVGVLALGITIALKIGGIDITAIMAAIGFGLGFAMQDLMTNFIAGILILLNRQFTIGDYIQVGDTVGKVAEIQSRATILRGLDGTRIIVPNASLFTNQVTSFTSNPFRRVQIDVGVDYRADLSYTHQVLYKTLQTNPGVLWDPKPAILIDNFGDASVDFVVKFWVDSHSNWPKTKSDLIHAIKENLDKAGIVMPYPTTTLVFDRDNEKVVMPTYSMSATDMTEHKKALADDDARLAAQIAASDQEEKAAKIASLGKNSNNGQILGLSTSGTVAASPQASAQTPTSAMSNPAPETQPIHFKPGADEGASFLIAKEREEVVQAQMVTPVTPPVEPHLESVSGTGAAVLKAEQTPIASTSGTPAVATPVEPNNVAMPPVSGAPVVGTAPTAAPTPVLNGASAV